MDNISNELGMSKKTIYKYFQDKESIATWNKIYYRFTSWSFYIYKATLVFGIQPELQYSMQGTKINSSTIRSIDYLNIPVLVRSSFGPINIHFGPQFGMLTGAINEISGIPTDIKDKLLKRDFSLVLGLSVEPVDRFIFSGRYVKGLKNISDDDPFANDTKNTTFQFSFGYVLVRLQDKNSKKNKTNE